MILRRQVIEESLDYLGAIVGRLEKLRAADRERFFNSGDLQWAAERGLQLGAQSVLDIGAHILAGHFGARPADYEDVIRLLAAHGVMSPGLESRLRGLGGFRNILVHGYREIDEAKVYDFLQHDSAVFRDFANAVEAWLAGTD